MKPVVRILIPSLALLLLSACGKHESSQASDALSKLPAVKVNTVLVRAEQVPSNTEVVGTVRPVQRAAIASKVMGSIDELPVLLGQKVKQGDLLVKISAAEISARLLQAQSQLNQAKRDMDRERELLARGVTPVDVAKGMEDRYAMTQAMVREAEVMLSYTTVRAPFDGVVSRRIANAGDLATPGMPLLEVEGTDRFQVEAGVPDSLASLLKTGARLSVELPSASSSIEGTLVEVSSAADASARTIPVKIDIPNSPSVRSGQFARIQVPGMPVPTLLVPTSSLVMQGQLELVFVVSAEQSALLRIVKSGAKRGAKIEILSGLSEGDRVVANPPVGLREGRKLEVQP